MSRTILATLTHGILRKLFGYRVALFLEKVAQKAQKCVGTWSAPCGLKGKALLSQRAPSELPAQVCLGTDKVAPEELWTSHLTKASRWH